MGNTIKSERTKKCSVCLGGEGFGDLEEIIVGEGRFCEIFLINVHGTKE